MGPSGGLFQTLIYSHHYTWCVCPTYTCQLSLLHTHGTCPAPPPTSSPLLVALSPLPYAVLYTPETSSLLRLMYGQLNFIYRLYHGVDPSYASIERCEYSWRGTALLPSHRTQKLTSTHDTCHTTSYNLSRTETK